MIDWTFALLFRPDIVKVSLDSEAAWLLREDAVGAAPTGPKNEQSQVGMRNANMGDQASSLASRKA